jgi:hypothetical protein
VEEETFASLAISLMDVGLYTKGAPVSAHVCGKELYSNSHLF